MDGTVSHCDPPPRQPQGTPQRGGATQASQICLMMCAWT